MKKINVFDYAETILKALPDGILLTTKADGKVNSMTIGWGYLGFEWVKPMFVTVVRESRYTCEMLAKNKEFTINVPLEATPEMQEILGFCGSMSGRDVDKVEACGLTLIDGEEVSVPAIKELPLTLECKVLYEQEQTVAKLPVDIADAMYPEGGKKDDQAAPHVAFYGEIVAAYIAE